jgi:hypothetical protein
MSQITEMRVVAHLSSNNEDDEEHDAALWDELCRRVREIAGDPRYADIRPFVD